MKISDKNFSLGKLAPELKKFGKLKKFEGDIKPMSNFFNFLSFDIVTYLPRDIEEMKRQMLGGIQAKRVMKANFFKKKLSS